MTASLISTLLNSCTRFDFMLLSFGELSSQHDLTTVNASQSLHTRHPLSSQQGISSITNLVRLSLRQSPDPHSPSGRSLTLPTNHSIASTTVRSPNTNIRTVCLLNIRQT